MRQTAGLGVLAALNVLVLLGTHGYLVTVLGPTRTTDALFAGMAVPQVILTIVSSSFSSVLVPLFVTTDRAGAQRDGWGVLVAVVAAFAGLGALLAVTAAYWVPLLVPGFSAADRALTVSLTQVQLTGVVLTAGAGVLAAFAQARSLFVWAELAPLVGGLCAFAALLVLLRPYGVMAAAWILVLRPLVHFVCLLPALGRWRRPDWRAPVLAEAWRRARPLLAGTAYYKLDPLLDRFLASMAPPGGLSLLTIGQQLYSAGAQVITRAMVVPIVPTLTTHAAQGRWRSFRSSYRRALLLTGGAVAASCLALVAGRGWITDLIGRFSELDPTEAAEFWTILVVLLGLFAGGSLGQITSTGFYAMTDTRTPARLGVRLFTLYVPAKLLSFFLFGLIGLAGSISGYYMVTLFVQLAVLENTVRRRALGEKVPGGAELMTDGRIPP